MQALESRTGPATLILDNLQAIHTAQLSDSFARAEAASRLRTALLVGFDEVLYAYRRLGAHPTAAAAAPGFEPRLNLNSNPGVPNGVAGTAAAAAACRARPPPPLVVVGVAGGGAASVDDGLARCFTAAK